VKIIFLSKKYYSPLSYFSNKIKNMKILVISDIHENFDNLVSVFQDIKDKNIEQVICL